MKNQELFDQIERIPISDAGARAKNQKILTDLLTGCGPDSLIPTQNNTFITNAKGQYNTIVGAALAAGEDITDKGPPSITDIFQQARHKLFLLTQAEELVKLDYKTLKPDQDRYLDDILAMVTSDISTFTPFKTRLKSSFDGNLCTAADIIALKAIAGPKRTNIDAERNKDLDAKKHELLHAVRAGLTKSVGLPGVAKGIADDLEDNKVHLASALKTEKSALNTSIKKWSKNKKDKLLTADYEKHKKNVEAIQMASTLGKQAATSLSHRVLDATTPRLHHWEKELERIHTAVNASTYNSKVSLQADLDSVKKLCKQIDELEEDIKRNKGLLNISQSIASKPEEGYQHLIKKANYLVKVKALSDQSAEFTEKVVRKDKVDEPTKQHGLEGVSKLYEGVDLDKDHVIHFESKDGKICIEQDHKGKFVDKSPIPFKDLSVDQQERSAFMYAQGLLRAHYMTGGKEDIVLTGEVNDAKQAAMVHAALLILTAPEPNNRDYIKFNSNRIKVDVPGCDKPSVFKWEDTFKKTYINTLANTEISALKEETTKLYRESVAATKTAGSAAKSEDPVIRVGQQIRVR